MRIENFDGLLHAAKAQAEPQRLLLVFTDAELPDDATAEQRRRFEAGQGGALIPLMCVDKSPEELDSFQALLEESRQMGRPWRIVFAAALSGSAGQAPGKAQIDKALQAMVDSIKAGKIASYIPFDVQGEAQQLN